MTTVSLVECSTPVSLRTCGSSVSSLVQNRKKLKCGTPDKKMSAVRLMTPPARLTQSVDLVGRGSASPGQRFSLEGIHMPAPMPSPIASPTPLKKQMSSPFCNRTNVKWNDYKYVSPSVSATSIADADADDFSDEDLDKYNVISRDTPDSGLQIVGSKPKLHGMYDVPSVGPGSAQSKTPSTANVQPNTPGSDANNEPQSSPSPENPPPSPINFRPSIKSLLVGGRRILIPERTSSLPLSNYSNRDFVPGFVKQPLHPCRKCTGRVIEEEQSVTSFNKRVLHYIHNRASPYRHADEDPTVTALRQGRTVRSQMLMCNPDSTANYLAATSRTSDHSSHSFVKIYMEKKRQKEAREREQEQQQERLREGKQKAKRFMSREKATSRGENADKNVSKLSNKCSQPSMYVPAHCNISDLSVADTVDIVDTDERSATSQPTVTNGGKFQVRRCWSDIWPFDHDMPTSQPIKKPEYDDDIVMTSTGCLRPRGRITPFYPLPSSDAPDIEDQGYAGSAESLVTNKSSKSDVGEGEVNAESKGVGGVSPSGVDVVIDETNALDSTMTSTVIVPERDRPCGQWITFTGDNEPVLNDAPPDNDGCDNFLKRLQRSKLYSNSDPSLPGNSQFCFEAVVDKRYNRWKRRRRKKKESESRRASVAQASDSSDEDAKDGAIERIIDRMYDKINGCPPDSAGGSRETPRIRNRRRRLNNDAGGEWKSTTKDASQDPDALSYDASSEWTSSDKDGGLISSSSGACNVTGYPPGKSDSATDDMCSWPNFEEYKQEMMMKISSTPRDGCDEFARNDWLPDINFRTLGTNRRRDSSDDSSQTPKEPVVRIRGKDGVLLSPSSAGSRPLSSETVNDKFSYSIWSRTQRTKPAEDRSKLLSRARTSTWDELGSNPSPANQVGVVSIGENSTEPLPFKAALKPIKNDNTSRKPKESVPNKNAELNLPALSKNANLQTVPKIEKSEKIKKPDPDKEHIVRPKTQPQMTRSNPGHRFAADKGLLFRDYYLRSMYNSKGHANSFNTGSKLKKTITVDQLDLGSNRRPRDKQRKADEDNPSSLSFTRSFTFSMFDLPDMYKLYNTRLERKVNGDGATTESD